MRGAVLCAALAALVPASAGAQSIFLTERDAAARLSADGARTRAARAAIDVARADVLAAGRWPNPRVNAERQAVASVTEYYTSVSQLLPISGRRGFDMQAATALVSARSSRADDAVRRLRADLQLAFINLVAAQKRERELTTSGDCLRVLAEVLAKRESAGDAAGFDRLRAEREVMDLESDLLVASTDRAIAQARLAGFFDDGVEPSRIVAVDRPAASLPAVPPLEALLTQAESARGDSDGLSARRGCRPNGSPLRRTPARARAGGVRRHEVIDRWCPRRRCHRRVRRHRAARRRTGHDPALRPRPARAGSRCRPARTSRIRRRGDANDLFAPRRPHWREAVVQRRGGGRSLPRGGA